MKLFLFLLDISRNTNSTTLPSWFQHLSSWFQDNSWLFLFFVLFLGLVFYLWSLRRQKMYSTNNNKVYIYESELNLIIAEAQKYPEQETGGSLFGSYTHGGMFVVWLASGPGANARGSRGEFEQDASFMTEWQRYLMTRFALQYIGGWHSHHIIGFKRPSSGDIRAIQQYAVRHRRYAALEIIVTHDFHNRGYLQTVPRAYFYPDATGGKYVQAKIEILDGESPVRKELGRRAEDFSRIVKEIDWRKVKDKFEYTANKTWSQTSENNQIDSHISKESRRKIEETSLGIPEGIPDVLRGQIENLEKDLDIKEKKIEIQQKGDDFMIIISLPHDFRLAIVLEAKEQKLKILKVSLIDDNRGGNIHNIDTDLNDINTEKNDSLKESSKLTSILKKSLKIKEELVSSN